MSSKEQKRNLRVCHMIGSLDCGGAERQFVNIMNYLPCDNKFAIFLQPHDNDSLFQDLEPEITSVALSFRTLYLPFFIWKISRYLIKWQIDVLHTHMYGASLYGALAAKMAGVPIVFTSEHGKNPWKNKLHYWIERSIISKIAFLRICVSEDIKKIRCHRDGIPPHKLVYIPNGTVVGEPAQRQESLPIHIGAVGRLVAVKDFLSLIRAAALVRDSGHEFQLTIIGDGPERSTMESEIETLELRSIVKLTGFQRNVNYWLTRFDLFVMSSLREGQPIALLEAMAQGLPIIATRVGGIPKTIKENRDGLLVEPASPEALATAMESLITDSKRRGQLGENAWRRVSHDFSIQSICNRYMDLYEKPWKDHGINLE